MVSITEFLEARIAEDEAAAREAIDPGGWGTSRDGRWRLVEIPYEGEWPRNPDAEDAVIWADSEWTLHASRHHPARVLAECAAKRQSLSAFLKMGEVPDKMFDPTLYAIHKLFSVNVIRPMAAVYADHPDYRQEWAA